MTPASKRSTDIGSRMDELEECQAQQSVSMEGFCVGLDKLSNTVSRVEKDVSYIKGKVDGLHGAMNNTRPRSKVLDGALAKVLLALAGLITAGGIALTGYYLHPSPPPVQAQAASETVKEMKP